MPDASSGIARINFGHYDPATGEVVQGGDTGGDTGEELYIRDLPAAVTEVPEAAAAMEAIIAAIPALRDWQNAKNQPDPVEDPVVDPLSAPE